MSPEKVMYKGKIVEGININFKVLDEAWNEYKLEDGTIIKFKAVITKIVRTSEYSENLEPVYVISSQNVATAMVPEKLKKRVSLADKRK